MISEPERDDTKHRVDAKIDSLLEKLNSLSDQVDNVAEQLARADSATVRRVFQEREGGKGGG
jgi:uncharacterized protein YdcH (DUF465 family)